MTLQRCWIIFLIALVHARVASGAESDLGLTEPGKLIFAASGEYRPFSYVNELQQLEGFDIDVGRAIAKHLNLSPSPRKYKFAGIVEGVKSGRFDLAVASHTITPKRRQHVAFTTPYYYSGAQVFVRPKSAVKHLDQLREKEIAVCKGSSYAPIAARFSENIKVYNDDVTALAALNRGRHDVVITDFVTGRMAIEQGMKLRPSVLIERSAQGIAVAKENQQLLKAVNSAIDHLRKSGDLSRISINYFGVDITIEPEASVRESQETKNGGKKEISIKEDMRNDSRTASNPVTHFFHVLYKSRWVFLKGARLTLELTVLSIIGGCILGLLFALLKLSRVAPLEWVTNSYVYVVRGTPLIVQIFVLYFGLTGLVKIPAFWAATFALAFHNGAYIAEIFRGAIASVDRGQIEAGRSLGMTPLLTYRRIVFPQAALLALPSLGNQFIIGLKDSSLAAFISMNELFNVATTQGANNFDQMTYLLVVAVYYLVMVLLLSFAVQRLERKLGKGMRS